MNMNSLNTGSLEFPWLFCCLFPIRWAFIQWANAYDVPSSMLYTAYNNNLENLCTAKRNL